MIKVYITATPIPFPLLWHPYHSTAILSPASLSVNCYFLSDSLVLLTHLLLLSFFALYIDRNTAHPRWRGASTLVDGKDVSIGMPLFAEVA